MIDLEVNRISVLSVEVHIRALESVNSFSVCLDITNLEELVVGHRPIKGDDLSLALVPESGGLEPTTRDDLLASLD
jgi:hypothetical protein